VMRERELRKHKYHLEKKEIPLHRCNDADYENFYPMNDRGTHTFEYLKKQGAFLCMSNTDINGKPYSKKIFGSSDLHEYRSIEIQFKAKNLTRYNVD